MNLLPSRNLKQELKHICTHMTNEIIISRITASKIEQMSDGIKFWKWKMNGKFDFPETFTQLHIMLCHLPNGQVQFKRLMLEPMRFFFSFFSLFISFRCGRLRTWHMFSNVIFRIYAEERGYELRLKTQCIKVSNKRKQSSNTTTKRNEKKTHDSRLELYRS